MIEQLLHFFINHWLLSAALVFTLALVVWEESKNKVGGFNLSLLDATRLINQEHAMLIDLRDNQAFASGHIVNAVNFPHAQIMQQLEKLKKHEKKPLILVDKRGQEANSLGKKLRRLGFNKTYSLAGGLQTWTNAGLPLTKSTT